MNTKLVNSAAGVINAALTQNRTPASIAIALDSAQLLITPETTAELAAFRALDLGDVDGRVSASCADPEHPSWLRQPDDLRGCPWCGIATLERAAVEARAALAALCFDLDDPGTAALGALYLLQQATGGTPMQPGETVPVVYRASHDSIPMGLYLTAAAAREHCEGEERRAWLTGTTLAFDWIDDEEDGVAELVVTAGQDLESVTGYVVTALEISAAYDREADE